MKYIILISALIPVLSQAADSPEFRKQPECRVSGTAAICQIYNEREDAALVCKGSVQALTRDGQVISDSRSDIAGPKAYGHFIIENKTNAALEQAKADLICFYRGN